MMKNYSKTIDDAINRIDWDVVRTFYKEFETISIKKKSYYKAKTVPEIKRELRDLITFAIEGNCKELHHDQWIISWDDNFRKGMFSLEVYFVASKSTSIEAIEDEELDEDMGPDMIERGVLISMLDKNVKEENFELAAVIRDRLKKLEKIIKRKSA